MISKVVYFVTLMILVWGSIMFATDMNPILRSTFAISSLMIFAFYTVWGYQLFVRKKN
jgi:hypothetical protein